MKKCRFIGIIIVLVILMMTFTGCSDPGVKVLIKYTEDSITVNADKNCSVDLTITIKTDERTDTITKKFKFKPDKTKTLTIEDFVSEYYGEEAVITEVTHGVPVNRTQTFWVTVFVVSVIIFLIWLFRL